MRVINVIKIKNNSIDSIDSFGVFEEQLSGDVVEKAENYFIELLKQENVDVENDDLVNHFIEDGYFSFETGVNISINWTYI